MTSRYVRTPTWIFPIFLVACLNAVILGQASPAEASFEANKSKYSRELYGVGEDASSGYDYVFYKNGPTIVKIRVIWSASYSKELRIDDYYFEGDGLLLARKFTAPKSRLNVLKKGRAAPLVSKESFHFENEKLSRWLVAGKMISPTDQGWQAKEKEILEQARSERESYSWIKETP